MDVKHKIIQAFACELSEYAVDRLEFGGFAWVHERDDGGDLQDIGHDHALADDTNYVKIRIEGREIGEERLRVVPLYRVFGGELEISDMGEMMKIQGDDVGMTSEEGDEVLNVNLAPFNCEMGEIV